MVGAENFRADVALVVTWENMAFLQASRDDQESKVSQIFDQYCMQMFDFSAPPTKLCS
jgi:hypothetical protein